MQHARPPCPSSSPGVHSNTSIESVMPSSHLILCRPLFLLPPIPPSIRVFSSESTRRMRWPKYWSFSSIIPSKEHPFINSGEQHHRPVCMRAKSIQSCPTLCDCSLPDSSLHGILQARILEWVAMPSSWKSSQPRDRTRVSRIAGRGFTV